MLCLPILGCIFLYYKCVPCWNADANSDSSINNNARTQLRGAKQGSAWSSCLTRGTEERANHRGGSRRGRRRSSAEHHKVPEHLKSLLGPDTAPTPCKPLLRQHRGPFTVHSPELGVASTHSKMLACAEMITMCLQSAKQKRLRAQQLQLPLHSTGLTIFHDVSGIWTLNSSRRHDHYRESKVCAELHKLWLVLRIGAGSTTLNIRIGIELNRMEMLILTCSISKSP